MVLITWGCENVSCQALGVWGLCAEWEEGKVSFPQDENQVSPFSQDLRGIPLPQNLSLSKPRFPRATLRSEYSLGNGCIFVHDTQGP